MEMKRNDRIIAPTKFNEEIKEIQTDKVLREKRNR